MINDKLINPNSIAVIGGSNDITKPGGKVLKNLIDNNFKGSLYVVNIKETEVQGLKSYQKVDELPQTDLAIIAVAARFVLETVEILVNKKNTKAFIILSAGFSEESEEGKKLEKKIVEIINNAGACLIGPNCIGVLNTNYAGVFTTPIPKLSPKGCDLISGSGATAVFIMESGIPNGLSFSNVFSVGNSAQLGVEDILEYLDNTYNPAHSSPVKLLYVENINNPSKLLKHSVSLIRKGCRIAAVKSGSSEAGSRAASSHTGALASPDVSVDALFRKAGIVRCYSREELTVVASVFMHPEVKGKNIAVITHAGGPAVMLTDALSNGGMNIPHLEGTVADELLAQLFPGSSVGNPIDFLATGTADQLGIIIDYCNKKLDNIDAMVVIFGSPGLFNVSDVYKLLDEKMKTSSKPIFPVLPSIINAKNEINEFLSSGRINFPDEVTLGRALTKIFNTHKPFTCTDDNIIIDKTKIRNVIDNANDGYISPNEIQLLLDAAGIPRAGEAVVDNSEKAVEEAEKLGYPVVMKVVGPVHKSDVGGVVLNVKNAHEVNNEFDRMIKIPDTTAILIQPMLTGTELFAGANRDDKFGHLIMFGLGGIFIEVLKDATSGLVPLSKDEAKQMIRSIKSYPIIKGVRGKEGIDEDKIINVLMRLSKLLTIAPEISELDLNPLLGKGNKLTAVDARIRISK